MSMKVLLLKVILREKGATINCSQMRAADQSFNSLAGCNLRFITTEVVLDTQICSGAGVYDIKIIDDSEG